MIGFGPYKVTEIGKGTLFVMAAPISGKGLEQDIIGCARLGINKIVSLLEPNEQLALGLAREETLCRQHGIDYVNFPIPDHNVADTGSALKFATRLLENISSGQSIVIHCYAGIGRTGIIAGAILVRSGVSATEAISLLSHARGINMPETQAQKQWLTNL